MEDRRSFFDTMSGDVREGQVMAAGEAVSESGNSDEQREAQEVMMALLADRLGVELHPATLHLPSGCRIEVDGCSADRTGLAEAWAHQGVPKAAQRAKVSKDAFKLAFAARVLHTSPRMVLLFSDEAAAQPFRSDGWEASALREFGIEVHTVTLPDAVRKAVLDAQRRQYR